jgi:hypothetical protein
MDYKGIIALTLAGCMGSGWIIGAVSIAYWHTPLSEKSATVLESLGIGMISIISFYVGRSTQDK